jgi:outer membrane protein
MRTRWLLTLFLLFLPCIMVGQSVLEEYIRLGLENNLALKQKEAGFQKSLAALKEARGLFYPDVSLNARYTRSEGGRLIHFPAGDLLNPVYTTLNTIIGSDLFPMIANQEIRFLRPREHETKMRLVQPVFNTDIYYNSRIRQVVSQSEEVSMEQYRRELVAEIKKAYYQAAMTASIVSMLHDTRLVMVENVRVNQRLLANSKITPDNLYRSQTELSRFDQELLVAEKNRKVAASYLNFLLNRPLNDSILTEEPVTIPLLTDFASDYTQMAIDQREELKKLEQYAHISDLQVQMNRSDKLPNLFMVVDYGFQGEKYRFNSSHDYMQASAVLSWSLFKGFQNRAKIQQAQIQKDMAENQLEQAKMQIELQVITILDELKASEKGIQAAESQVKSAGEGFRLVQRKYEEGQSSLIEFMDARNSFTLAQENLIISRFSYLVDMAEFERVIAVNKP